MHFFSNTLKKPLLFAAAFGAATALVFIPTVAQAEESHFVAQDVGMQATQTAFDEIDEALLRLSGTQSQNEIDSLIDLGYTHVLVDGDTEERLAAIHTGPSFMLSPFSITQLGPGCSGNSAC